jgi:L-fucose mutarotase
MKRFIVKMKRYKKMNRYKKYVQLWFSAANQSSSAASDPMPFAIGQAVSVGRREGATVLKGIDHRLNAEVLATLRAMGHGDVLVLADLNFPADNVARSTATGRALRMDNLTSAQAAQAILSVLPLDTFVEDFAMRMEVVGDPAQIQAVQAEVADEITRAEGRRRPMVPVERFAFYAAARQAHAVIQTGERRFYGCFMFRKGVIGP